MDCLDNFSYPGCKLFLWSLENCLSSTLIQRRFISTGSESIEATLFLARLIVVVQRSSNLKDKQAEINQ